MLFSAGRGMKKAENVFLHTPGGLFNNRVVRVKLHILLHSQELDVNTRPPSPVNLVMIYILVM